MIMALEKSHHTNVWFYKDFHLINGKNINWTIPHKLNEGGIKWTIYILWLNTKKETGRFASRTKFAEEFPCEHGTSYLQFDVFDCKMRLQERKSICLARHYYFTYPQISRAASHPILEREAFEWRIKFLISWQQKRPSRLTRSFLLLHDDEFSSRSEPPVFRIMKERVCLFFVFIRKI